MATYGNFPGVQVETEQGGIQSVNIGVEEKVVLFGPANYDADGNVDGEASVGELVGVNSPSEASKFFGEGSELTEAIGEALLNGASINLLRAVAVPRVTVSDEVQSAQTGTLGGEAEGDINPEIVENTDLITATDGGTELNVQFRYTPGPAEPSANDMVYINPLTGEYALGEAPTDLTFSYEYYDYRSAFFENSVSNYINESETGVLFALSDSNVVSNDLVEIVETFRDNYQLVTGFSFAEPNTQLDLDESEVTPFNGGAEPRYNANNYGTSGNQSVSDNAYFKPVPARVELGSAKTIGGGLAGKYAGNPISDAVYNEVVSGYSSLEQSINKSQAGSLRAEDLIPVRSESSVRVKGNRATNFSESGTVAASFFARRITDRVILVVKQIGDAILGLINNPDTRQDAEDAIDRELGSLAREGLIKDNEGEELNYKVEVFESSTNKNEVDINVSFTPFGIVKQVDASVTVNV
jgi:hypothetical protein